MNRFPGSLALVLRIPLFGRNLVASARNVALCALGCLAAVGAPALAQTATTTTLAISGGGSAVTTVPMGTVVTLTATVKAGSTLVSPGQVKFCDATAAHCEDIHIVGVAQLTSAGTAVVRFRPGVGSHSYNAVFLGTPNGSPAYAGSASANGSLTVSAPAQYPSITQLSVASPTGTYQLGATVSGIGSAPPTGSISFIDTSNANAVLGTAALSSASSSYGLANVSNPATGTSPAAIAVADFNLDGIPDIATVNGESRVDYFGPDGSLSILLGNGDGTFNAAATSATTSLVTAVVTGDFNGDGIPDLALMNLQGPMTILLGNGDGTFHAAPSPPVALSPSAIEVGDFNGDGNLDIAVLNYPGNSGSQITILLGHGDGTFTQGPTTALSNGTTTLFNGNWFAVADLNGDGKLDIAAVSLPNNNDSACVASSCGELAILIGNGDGTFTIGPTNYVLSQFPLTIAAADLNGDGIPDLAITDQDASGNGLVDLLLGNGNGTFTAQSPVSLGAGQPQFLAVGDFKGDGIPDLAITMGGLSTTTDLPYPDSVVVLLGKGDGTFPSPPYEAVPPGVLGLDALGGIAAGDFNGDGLPDLAVSDFGLNTATVLESQTQFDVAPTQTAITLSGAKTHLVEASYSGDTSYLASTSPTAALNLDGAAAVSMTVSAATITYGTSETLTATVTVSGPTPTGTVSFYNGDPSEGVIIAAGIPLINGVATTPVSGLPVTSYSLVAVYSGDDNYPAASSPAVSLLVNKATPTIVWTVPATITYGTQLPPASVQGNVQGTFSFAPGLNAPLNVGMQSETATFTASDTNDYNSATDTVKITVTQGTPSVALSTNLSSNTIGFSMPVTFNALVTIGIGSPTGTVSFYDGSSLLGSATTCFCFDGEAYAIFTISTLSVGTHSITAVYNGDSNDLPATSGALSLTVTGGAKPPINWATPSSITYGTALSATQLNATSTVAGSFVYTPAAGTVLGAGTQTLSVTFTPTDTTDYTTATATVSINVTQATPTITWAAPAAITYGTALGATQLDATSTVAGSFAYTPAAGTVPAVGTQTLSVTFTPTDATDYKTANSSVSLTVNKAAPTIALATSASPAYVLNPVLFTATVSSAAGTPTGTVAFYDGTTLLSTSSMTSGVATYQTSALLAGTHSITAVYSGDTNFLTETSSALSQVIENFTIGATGGTSSVTANPGGQAVYTFTVTPPSGTTFAGPISFSVTGLPTGATATFSPTTVPAGAGATPVTMTVTLASSAAMRPAERPFPGRPFGGGAVALGLVLIPFVGLPFAGRLRRTPRGLKGMVCLVVLGGASLALMAGLSGCGGSGGGGSSTPPPQNYVLTVTATAGSLSNTFAVGLVVE
jgi:hypothetical protein